MLRNSTDVTSVSPKAALVTLFVVVGLAACGSGASTSSTATPPPSNTTTTTVSASATPALVAYGATAVITWSSTDSTSCSSSPAGISGTAGTYSTPALTATTTYTITCTGPTGPASKGVTIAVGSTSIVNAAQCTPYPPLSGTTYYYCDCGTGADPDCINHIGNDANAGTDIALPRRTIGNAMTRFNSMAANDTVALCRGGAFDTTSISIGASRCAPGSKCNDLRDYSATGFGSTAKPIINFSGSNSTILLSGNKGGARLLHLSLKGRGTNNGFFFYEGAHDVVMCGLDMDNFAIAVYIESNKPPVPNNITLTGSNITNSSVLGYLGGGNNTEISYNNWEGNGSNNALNHTLYFSSTPEIANITAIGNNIHGQYGPACLGAPVEAHGHFNGFLFKNNHISIDASAARGGCWGIELDNLTGDTSALYLKNLVVSGNTVINGGNTGVVISNAPGLVFENNIVIQDWDSGGAVGVSLPGALSRVATGDWVSDNQIIRNNTVYFGPNATGTNTGIYTHIEGTGHVVSNNTVSSTQTSGSLNCFRHDLPLASYEFINNNHCYSSTVSNRWEATRGTLAAWQTYSAARGFDSASITGISSDPMFTTAGTNFRPASGSPLIGAGAIAPYMAPYGFNGTTARSNPPAIGAYEFNEP